MTDAASPHPSPDLAAASPPRRRYRWNVGWPPVLEVLLIALGVFLGLAGEQWRDRVARQDRAIEALRRIRAEVAANRDAVTRVADYHARALTQIRGFLAKPAQQRDEDEIKLEGIRSAQFENTAWQLAQSTQALVDIDPDLSFSLARIYGAQALYESLTSGINHAMYLRPPTENMTGFLNSLALYYGDVVEIEPALVTMYDEMLPQIDRELDR